MININQTNIADVDINLAATLLIIGVFVMTLRKRSDEKKADAAYLGLVIATLVVCVCGLVLEFIEGPVNPGPVLLAMTIETILDMSINLMLLSWLLYAFFVMYDSIDYLKRRLALYMVPIAILMVLEIVNLFNGMLWYYDENVVYHDTVMYSICDVIRYAYLFISVFQYRNYKKENGRMQFFTIWPYLLSMLWGTLIELTTEISGFTLGAAIGVTMVFIMASPKASFTDEESGFYNLHYLNMLYDKVRQKEYDPRIVIRYHLPEGAEVTDFFSQLKDSFPDSCDTIKLDDLNYTTIIYGNTRGLINMLSEDIETIASSLNLDIRFDYVIKEKKETALEFLEKNLTIGG